MKDTLKQRLMVFQQNNSGEAKIRGIEEFAPDMFYTEIVSIDMSLPPVIDDPQTYLPPHIHCDLVLDYLSHPDLSYELALICSKKGIPVVASGKRWNIPGVYTPPT